MELYNHNKTAHAYGLFMMEKYVTPHPTPAHTHTQYPVWPQNLFLFEVDLLNPIICIGTHGIPPRCILSNYMVCKIKGTASII